MRVLHFDAAGGASGDMLLAALLAVGADEAELRRRLKTLPVADEFEIEVERTKVKGLSGVRVRVKASEGVAHRNLSDVLEIIERAQLGTRATELAKRIFRRLAEAEAEVHGTTPEYIHFHEVGAVDSIVDICGAAVALDLLAPQRITASALPIGIGFVDTAHGKLPLPAPATLKLLEGLPVRGLNVKGELLTPTAAAFFAEVVDEFGSFPSGVVVRAGTALGHTEFENHHNLLRAVLLDTAESIEYARFESVVELATVIDDQPPAVLAAATRKLLAAGALDVWTVPVLMKKGRMGHEIVVLASAEDEEKLLRLLVRETATLGVRVRRIGRFVFDRGSDSVETRFGKIRRKLRSLPEIDSPLAVPEFDDCEQAASDHDVPVWAVQKEAERAERYPVKTDEDP